MVSDKKIFKFLFSSLGCHGNQNTAWISKSLNNFQSVLPKDQSMKFGYDWLGGLGDVI